MIYNTKQELLDKLLKQELKYLKKKFFPRVHKPFLRRNVTICAADMEDASGRYTRVEGENPYMFSHKIEISNNVIEDYVNYKRNYFEYTYMGICKKHYKNRLKQVIVHELIHCFAEDYYQQWSDIQGIARDASPIFLSLLYWCGGKSSHDCVRAFRHTELYSNLKTFDKFESLDSYLTKLIWSYEKLNDRLSKDVVKGDKLQQNQLKFAHRCAGLKPVSQIKVDFKGYVPSKITQMESNVWEVGCCISPQQIEKLIDKKRLSGQFEYYDYSKSYITKSKTVKIVQLIKSDNLKVS